MEKTLEQHLEEFNKNHALVLVDGKQPKVAIIDKKITILTINSFKILYSNLIFEDKIKGKIYRKQKAKAWLKWEGRRTFSDTTFYPGKVDENIFNFWEGWSVSPEVGNITPILDFITANFEKEEGKYVLNWMAHGVQFPEENPLTTLVLTGKNERAKTIIANFYGSLFGDHFGSQNTINQKFDSYLYKKLLVFYTSDFFRNSLSIKFFNKVIDKSDLVINNKKIKNYCRFIFSAPSNVKFSSTYKRAVVLNINDKFIDDDKHLKMINDWCSQEKNISAFLHLLLNLWDLSEFDIRQFPTTNN